MKTGKPLAENVHIAADGSGVEIIDQTALPGAYVTKVLKSREEMVGAICRLEVRGAPAIGIFAAYSLYALSEQRLGEVRRTAADILSIVREEAEALKAARPTAVNLAWAVDRLVAVAERTLASVEDRTEVSEEGQTALVLALGEEAEAIQAEDIAMCRAIAEYGLSVLRDGDGVLTHCNAGPLATSRYGTALGPLLLAKEEGLAVHVFADETRPLLQGARLTAYELARAGVDVTLICDNMAATVMRQGKVQACFVGCDRIAANGDTANKIGTSGVAVLAQHYHIPFYVLGPSSTVDLACPDGSHIPIEERDADEISRLYFDRPVAPEGVRCYNPAFDVTDHDLITGIVTEKGIVRAPFDENLRRLFGE